MKPHASQINCIRLKVAGVMEGPAVAAHEMQYRGCFYFARFVKDSPSHVIKCSAVYL
jgi:hypothetical protein